MKTFWHFIWGSDKPVLILRENKNLTRFFQAKAIPPTLWKYVDRVTAFNIVVAHVPGKANAVADFLSRLQSDANETIELKPTDHIPIREIEIDGREKLPDNTINELFTDDFLDWLLQVVDINTLIRLKQSGKHKQTSQRLKGITEHCTNMKLIEHTTPKGRKYCDPITNPNGHLPATWNDDGSITEWTKKRSINDEGEKVEIAWKHPHQQHILDRIWAKIPQTNAKTADW